MLSTGYLAGIPSLIAIRLVAAFVFAALYFRDRKPVQLLILTGWLIYALATLLLLTSTGNHLPIPTELQHILSSGGAYFGTALLLLAAACYIHPEILSAARSIIVLMLVLTAPAVLLSDSSGVAIYFIALQGFAFFLGASLLWFERRAALENLGYGYYGVSLVVVTGLVMVSIVLTGQYLPDISVMVNTSNSLILIMVFISAEHHETMEKLRQSSIRLAQAENLAKIGYWERNVITDQAYWSSGHYKVFGIPEDRPALSIEALNDLIHPEDLDDVKRVYRRIQHGSPYEYYEFRVVLPNGEIRWIKSDTTQQEGVEHWVFGVTQDITERKLLELSLTQALEEKSSQLEALGLGLSGSFQTILRILRTQLQQYSGSEHAAGIVKMEQRLDEFMKQYQRSIRSGFYMSAPVYLQSLCAAFTHELVYDVEEFTLAPELMLPLGIIVHELVDNSVVHGVETGAGFETKGQISLACHKDGGEVVLVVQDNGPGFAAEFLKGFEDEASAEDGIALNGQGLGFVVVRALSARIHAQLSLMNSKGARVELRVTPAGQPYS
ncbi:MAG: PAS domain S-box protein [Spirochaetaceae bacterium]|nr:MAG: PAS domain S-box protein [Spirochaetaceae bacterium]